jgi:predicted nucleic acid-binding protein
MSATIISDTSCLILLTNADKLHFLEQLFDKVYITPTIAAEYKLPIPKWIEIRSPSNSQFEFFKEILFDEGESSAFALQSEIPEAILVLDDRDARKLALKLKLRFMGTLGIIKLLKEKKFIENGGQMLNELKKVGMRLSPELEEDFLKMIGEI